MNSHALLSHAAAFALRVAAPLMAIVPNARADGAPKADPARLEEPTHGPFEPCASCKDFTIGTRPWDGKTGNHGVYDLWMRLPGTGRSEYRIAPTQFADGKNDTLDASCPPDEGLVSPDARWVAFSQKYCRSYAVAFVLQRDPAAGMKPLPSLVSELGWERFFVDHPDAVKRRGQMSGITNYVESSICDLVAWEADSSGVWFALRGGDRRGTGIYRWYFLWDAVTGKVRVPERVRAINKQAAVRWSSDERPLSADEIAMEAEHIVFLAELEWKLSHRRKK